MASKKYFNNPELSDIKIKFGDNEIFAHRYELCKRSGYFEKLLTGESVLKDAKEITLDGDGDGNDALMAMLRHAYGLPYLPLTVADNELFPHVRVYIVAEKYGMYDLPCAVYERISKSLLGAEWKRFSSDLSDSLSALFSETPVGEDWLQPELVKICVDNMATWDDYDFGRVLKQTPDLATALFSRLGQIIGGAVKAFACPCCFEERLEDSAAADLKRDDQYCGDCGANCKAKFDDDATWLGRFRAACFMPKQRREEDRMQDDSE
ncbi:hypothetical protein B0A48_13483 [Cryoendolithus antarcticus]|uniref:BTB domain-containing protein n=1 Tax=Cryoendolithus antarcticus TaxID=1507870 RepID=A0A1V8SNP9_9PEZI|nr:hypothetical protein B0A48_13483 [Cryoendolithus antarcticus]